VKVNNILTMMGSGVVLGLTGGILIVSSAALGLNATFPALPQWASFLIVGVVTAGAGGFLLSRSGAETSKKIEKVERKLTLQELWRTKPWLMLGASVAAGFVAQRLLRSMFASEAKSFSDVKSDDEAFTPEALYEKGVREGREERKKAHKEHSSFKDFIMKPFADLARHAASRAVSIGTQMVVTPLLMKKLQEFMDQHNMNFAHEQHDATTPGHDGQSGNDYTQPQANGNGARRF